MSKRKRTPDLNFDDHEPVSLERMRYRIEYRRGRRSLLNYLEAVELTKGLRFIVRTPNPTRTEYKVTLASIRAHAPELIRAKDRPEGAQRNTHFSLREAREFLAYQDEKMANHAAEAVERRVRPDLDDLKRRMRAVESQQKRQ